VPTVVLDILAAMTALLHGCSHKIAIKHSRPCALDVVKHSIMTWRQAIWNWQAVRLIDGDPMLERHLRQGVEKCAVLDQPFGEIVDKKRTPRGQNPYGFSDPLLAPFEIFGSREIVASVFSIVLLEIERGGPRIKCGHSRL